MRGPERPAEVNRLEGLFRHIERVRMAGIPILNPALRVEAVGFRPWNGYQLGVLITPWFMNLVLLGEGESGVLAGRRPGDKVMHAFPSGAYEFIVAEEPGLDGDQGRYQACSLFSPMQAFDSQALALATAAEILRGLMQTENSSGISTRSREIAEAWGGDQVPASDGELHATELDPAEQGPTLSERLESPVTRRELLTGPSRG